MEAAPLNRRLIRRQMRGRTAHARQGAAQDGFWDSDHVSVHWMQCGCVITRLCRVGTRVRGATGKPTVAAVGLRLQHAWRRPDLGMPHADWSTPASPMTGVASCRAADFFSTPARKGGSGGVAAPLLVPYLFLFIAR